MENQKALSESGHLCKQQMNLRILQKLKLQSYMFLGYLCFIIRNASRICISDADQKTLYGLMEIKILIHFYVPLHYKKVQR